MASESVHSSAAYLCKKLYMRISEFMPGLKALSKRIRFDLKTQLFLCGYSDVRLPSTRSRWKRSMKTELFENAHQSGTFWKHYFRVYMWTEENWTFRKRWRHTIPIDGGRALHFIVSLRSKRFQLVRSLSVFIVTGPIQAPIFARSWKILPVCETEQRCKYEFAVQRRNFSLR